jgi:hypothetical protein
MSQFQNPIREFFATLGTPALGEELDARSDLFLYQERSLLGLG